MVQKLQCLAQRPQRMRVELAQVAGGESIRQLGTRQPAQNRLAQIGLRHAGHRGVNGRERRRQITTRWFAMRVQHGPAHKAAPHLTPGTNAVAHAQCLLLIRIKVEEAQGADIRTVIDLD